MGFLFNSMEIFKDILKCDRYEVSNLGQIRNKKTQRILKPTFDSYGYHHVDLYSGKTKMKVLVHRIVLETFIGCKPDLTVHHINHIRHDNRLENLQWMTREENSKEANIRDFNKFKRKIKSLYEQNIFKDIEEFYNSILDL